MGKVRLSERERLLIRKKCLSSLWNFCVLVMGYDDMTDDFHRGACRFLESTTTRKQLTFPRGFLKTCICSIAQPIWLALPRTSADEMPEGVATGDGLYRLGTNIRILLASNVIENARKIIGNIRKVYERGEMFRWLFPDVVPNFSRVKWSDSSSCVARSMDFTESTFEAAGVGGSAVSRHYDLIIEDDLIYAKKDDLSGQELQPNQDDIDKAIGWHKLALSLFVPGYHTTLLNVGTRWAKHDLVDFIRANERQYKIFELAAVYREGDERPKGKEVDDPVWGTLYSCKKLQEIKDAQGPYMYSTQYLNLPMAPEDMLFKGEWLQYYRSQDELPQGMRIFTTVDLAGWGKTKRKRHSRAVILTCGWDLKNHMWLLHYDVGRFDPTVVIEKIAMHWKRFKPELIGIEEVYYQKSLAHFARKAMERGDVPWLPLRQLKPESGESKDLRIRALEPIASNLALHCRLDHKDFIEEFCEYVSDSDMCKNDIMDAAAYQVRIARPGEVEKEERKKFEGELKFEMSADDLLADIFGKGKETDAFGNPVEAEIPGFENLGEDDFNPYL